MPDVHMGKGRERQERDDLGVIARTFLSLFPYSHSLREDSKQNS